MLYHLPFSPYCSYSGLPTLGGFHSQLLSERDALLNALELNQLHLSLSNTPLLEDETQGTMKFAEDFLYVGLFFPLAKVVEARSPFLDWGFYLFEVKPQA